MGDDRMDSRLEEGFRKIPEMWTAPSFCSATVGLLLGGLTHKALNSCQNTPELLTVIKMLAFPPLPQTQSRTYISGKARAGTRKPGSSVRTEELTKAREGRQHLPGGE